MAFTARDLITRSSYLSGILARSLDTVPGNLIADGLNLLNALLDFKTIEVDLIPYYTVYNMTSVVGQEAYFIENLYEIESLTFEYDTVRYSTYYTPRSIYFGSPRVNNISSLPFAWYFNRGLKGGTLYIYFLPQLPFPLQIVGKFGLTDVTLDTDLTTVYDKSYIEYLRYALAEYMCNEYNISFSPENKEKLISMQRTLMYISPPDLSVKKISILRNGPGFNWGDINIGIGYRP